MGFGKPHQPANVISMKMLSKVVPMTDVRETRPRSSYAILIRLSYRLAARFSCREFLPSNRSCSIQVIFSREFFMLTSSRMSRTSVMGITSHRPLSHAAVTFPAGAVQIRLARRPKFGWRRRQTFPATVAEFGASS